MMKSRFTFKVEDFNDELEVDNSHERIFHATTLPEIIEQVQVFLEAAGFIFPGGLEVIENEEELND